MDKKVRFSLPYPVKNLPLRRAKTPYHYSSDCQYEYNDYKTIRKRPFINKTRKRKKE